MKSVKNHKVQINTFTKENESSNTVLTEDVIVINEAEFVFPEQDEKYRNMITQSPDGIFIVDLTGSFLFVNKKMCENFKYTEEEFLSMKIWDIIPQQFLLLHRNKLADVINGDRKNETAEYEAKGKEGNITILEVLSVPYFEGDEVVGFQSIARDITERRKNETNEKIH